MRIYEVGAAAVLAVVFGAFAWPAPGTGAEEWMLMGREGGCVTLDAAAERRPVFSGITTPDQLVARLRAEGEEVSRKDLVEQGGVTVVQVDAPGQGLGLIFVPRSLCG